MEDIQAKPVEENVERLTPEELQAINQAKAKTSYAMLVVEKAYGNVQIAKLEVENLLLTFYNRHQINIDTDEVTDDGVIHRNVKTKEDKNGQ